MSETRAASLVSRLQPGARRIPAELWDARVEAARLLAEARAAGEEILAAARDEAEHQRREATAEGREEGVARVAQLVLWAAAERDRLLARAEGELVALAFEVAERVLLEAAERDRDLVVRIAARALERARRCARVRLRAHPLDVAALREAAPRLGSGVEQAGVVVVVGDPDMSRGGVVLETEAGIVDARLPTVLGALRAALERGLGVPQSPELGGAEGPP